MSGPALCENADSTGVNGPGFVCPPPASINRGRNSGRHVVAAKARLPTGMGVGVDANVECGPGGTGSVQVQRCDVEGSRIRQLLIVSRGVSSVSDCFVPPETPRLLVVVQIAYSTRVQVATH